MSLIKLLLVSAFVLSTAASAQNDPLEVCHRSDTEIEVHIYTEAYRADFFASPLGKALTNTSAPFIGVLNARLFTAAWGYVPWTYTKEPSVRFHSPRARKCAEQVFKLLIPSLNMIYPPKMRHRPKNIILLKPFKGFNDNTVTVTLPVPTK